MRKTKCIFVPNAYVEKDLREHEANVITHIFLLIFFLISSEIFKLTEKLSGNQKSFIFPSLYK